MSFESGIFTEITGVTSDGFRAEPILSEEGLSVTRLTFTAPEPTGNFSFVLRFPMKGLMSTWRPVITQDTVIHQWFEPVKEPSSFAHGAPVIAAVESGKKAAVLVSASDAVNESEFWLFVNDFADRETVEVSVRFLTGRVRLSSYTVDLRVDTRGLSLAEALRENAVWWAEYYPARQPVPAEAYDPLYSSWYNFHQHPNGALLEKELEEAAAMGFKTVILDDGWQYDGNGTGDYRDCGEWHFSEEKFPDFKAFSRKVHSLGMKLMLWFTVPFVGKNTPLYEKFLPRSLYSNADALVLDPRYKEVREFIETNLVNFTREYGLDGLKLDFIDSFVMRDVTPPANDEMDEPDLSRAVITLLTELEARLLPVCPGALLEYRQNYVGPAINRFGNMLRVGDCAFSSLTNRNQGAKLRLLALDTAVHADMLYWAHDEEPEACAKQLLDILFFVPQISVLLTRSTEAQKRLIRAYLAYWTAHRDVLMHGTFEAEGADMSYTRLTASDKKLTVTALYAGEAVTLPETCAHVFNAGTGEMLFLHASHKRFAVVYDMYGEKIREVSLTPGWNSCPVPRCGRIEIGE